MFKKSSVWAMFVTGMALGGSGCAPDALEGGELVDEQAADEADASVLDKAQSCEKRCSPSCPCREGEGDCDSNADCASGLVCPPDRDGKEVCEKRAGGGGGSSSGGGSGSGSGSGGGGGGSSGSSGSSNLQVKLGGSWRGVCCSGGELEVSSANCSWTESSRVLKTKDVRSGSATALKCPENSQRPADCSCSSSGERMHGIAANGSVHVKNSLRLPEGAPIYPNSGHETCLDLVGNELQSRRTTSNCPNWRLRNFY